MEAPGRRKAVARMVRELLRLLEEAERAVDEALRGLSNVDEARLVVEELYRFPEPRQPGLKELREMVRAYMGLREGETVEEYLKSLGRRSTRPI